ncbi:MAG TPA: hypothetical protein VKB38_20445 [Terracidiphilus sp.]|nr:hypothetical protein [Terracidiphilus sp.]
MNSSFDDIMNRLASESDAIGRLAQDSGGFSAVVAAFEAKDPDAFRWVLQRLEMLPWCELICEWIRIKLCVLRCLELCGPPEPNEPLPTFEQFARAIAQLSANEAGLRRVVDAVSCGNREEFAEVLQELKLAQVCRFICHWVCGIGYRRVCEVICSGEPAALADPVSELRAAGAVIQSLLRNESALAAISKAALEPNCEILRNTINAVGFAGGCQTICLVICFWRCFRVCRELCIVDTEPIEIPANGVEEARSFALAFRKLGSQPRALGDLVTAVQNGDRAAYGQIVSGFGLRAYCLQICAWVCALSCREFCFCVCPPLNLDPWFTTVGDFGIYSDIDSGTGLTNKALPVTPSLVFGGGPNFAFFEQLQLGGFCPVFSPTVAGAQMQYRFLFSTQSTTLASAINSAQTTITVAGGAAPPPTPFTISVCNAGESGETMTVTGVAASTWTVTRGQDGTTAEPAGAGATVWINPAPVTGGRVAPVKLGTRIISWPQDLLGVAQAANVPTFQDVYVTGVNPPPPDIAPPIPTHPWFGPGIHYIAADPATGWVVVDLNAVGGGFQVLMGFDTTQPGVAPGGDPLSGASAIDNTGEAPVGSPVPAASQKVGVDMAIIFQATRVAAAPSVDFSNSLCKIHVNNWSEVNHLWFHEFTVGAGCCQPIDDTLTIQFVTDHEMLGEGDWALSITSCSPSAPGNIPVPNPTPGVTFTAGGRGASGSIVENTTAWDNCSYTAHLVTRPALTTGLADRTGIDNQLTFCICGHKH